MPAILELQEQIPGSFTSEDLPSDAALALARSGRFEVEFASPLNGNRSIVTSRGWVGHIPVTADLMFRIKPKVPVTRLFDLLEVAYNLKSFRLLVGNTQIESMDDLTGRLASILAKRVLNRARRGLYGGYREESAQLSSVRGRIDPARTFRSFIRGGVSFTCTYDDHSRDLDENRILLWTLHKVARLEGLRATTRREVMGAYRAIGGLVTLMPCLPSDCISRLYNRLNDDYQPMHGLCRLLLEHMGPGVSSGNHDFVPFMLNMPSLFELFMAQWLATHLPENLEVHTQYHAKLKASAELEVRIDIVLRNTISGANIAVLDTKYKDVAVPSMTDVQQAAFYANEISVQRAFLIYPSSGTRPFWVRNGDVTIQTLVFDLGVPLEEAGHSFLQELHRKLFSTLQ